jgi:[ribosomal protein S5]-alanine N-acetyltransferase
MKIEYYPNKLESRRLVTRRLTKNDAAIWAEFFADNEAFEFLPSSGSISNAEKAAEWIDRQINRYKDNTYGLLALIEKSNHDFIGQCGLLTQEVDGMKELEVGYHVLKKYRGQGYATEAAGLFINHAFKNKLSTSVISIIDIWNLKSKRVAEKNGLK